jgi:hypothetical protein
MRVRASCGVVVVVIAYLSWAWSDTIRWRRAAIVELRKLGIDL